MLYSTEPSLMTTPVMQEKKMSKVQNSLVVHSMKSKKPFSGKVYACIGIITMSYRTMTRLPKSHEIRILESGFKIHPWGGTSSYSSSSSRNGTELSDSPWLPLLNFFICFEDARQTSSISYCSSPAKLLLLSLSESSSSSFRGLSSDGIPGITARVSDAVAPLFTFFSLPCVCGDCALARSPCGKGFHGSAFCIAAPFGTHAMKACQLPPGC
mmetsp:Transcript_64892/g.152599  ORF Transcript_64892/g.152599 Transcript_64892/m.152599 type:complete len:212 (-) Transcript_64892:721-1356(-)